MNLPVKTIKFAQDTAERKKYFNVEKIEFEDVLVFGLFDKGE